MNFTLLLFLFSFPLYANLNPAEYCKKEYPWKETLIKKPLKVVTKIVIKTPVRVAYYVMVKKPVQITKTCFKQQMNSVKQCSPKKPWKCIPILVPVMIPFSCTETVYEDVKEERFRDEIKEEIIDKIVDSFEEIKELKPTVEYLSCLEFLDKLYKNTFPDTKTEKYQAKIENLQEKEEIITVVNGKLIDTYKVLFRGDVGIHFFSKKSVGTHDHPFAMDKCSHQFYETILATAPCLVDSRPIIDSKEESYFHSIPFSCEKDFIIKKELLRDLENGIEGQDNKDCGKIYSYIYGKMEKKQTLLKEIFHLETGLIKEQFQASTLK